MASSGPGDDWDKIFREKDPRLTEVHRGLRIWPHADAYAHAHDESRPVAERAHALLGHIGDLMKSEGRGIGMSWSDSPTMARQVAGEGGWSHHGLTGRPDPASPDYDDRPFHMPVVLNAAWPEKEHIETRQHVLDRHGVFPYDDIHVGQGEVPIREGAPVKITGISWAKDGTERDTWNHHTFDQPVHYNGTEFEHHDFGHEPREAARKSWYHGSNEEWAAGDQVLPAAQAGRQTRGGPGDESRVWVSSDPYRAGAYGAHVYEVTPSSKPRHARGPDDEHETDSAAVVRRLTQQEARDLSPSYQEQAVAYAKTREAALLGHFEAAGAEDYGMGHRPLRDGAPAHDLTEGYQEDIYTHPQYWAAAGWPEKSSGEGLKQLIMARGNPDKKVAIFRASPPGAPYRMHTGDWVSLSPTYARQHAYNEGGDGADAWHVHQAVVPAKHVRDAGTDQYREQGYWGPDIDSIHHSGPRPEEAETHREAAVQHQAASPEEYGQPHRPDPTGPPLHDLSEGDMMPRDFYDRMHEYNLHSHDDGLLGEAAYQAERKIRLFRGKPEKLVTIWRSAPAVNPESRNAKRGEINHGDWVGLSRHKALAESFEVNDPSRGSLPANHPQRYHVWSARVPAKHVRNPDGDMTEWGYFGPDVKDIPHISEQCSHRARVKPAEASKQTEVVAHFEETAVQHHAAGETAPEGHQIWAVPQGRSPVGDEVYHNMGHREPGDEHGSAWYQGISYHGPYHVIRHPQTRQVWLVDRHGRDASPTGGHYGNPERDGNWGEHQAWEHQHGLESAGPEAHRFGTPDEPRLNLMNERVPEFPHTRVDPEDEERVRRPAPRVHAPEGHSPDDEYHGSYEVVQHPGTGRYHVVDNAGRHAHVLPLDGFGTQLQAERSRDYTEKRQRSKEIGRGIANSIFDKGMEALDPGGTQESRQSEENMRTASEMMDRYHGGLGEIKFDSDEEGGRPYYEREHLHGNGTPSGWYAKHYGGPQTDVYHRATGDESHAHLHLPQHPEDENVSMTPRLHPQFGDEHLAGALKDWHDDEEGGGREYIEANDSRVSRWKKRHLAAAYPVVEHFEDPGPRPFTAAAGPGGGDERQFGYPRSDEEMRAHLEGAHRLIPEEIQHENHWDLHHEEHSGGWENPEHQHEQFYHGTSLGFPDDEEPPERIVPQGNHHLYPGMHSGDHAFASSDPSDAWHYAEAAYRSGRGEQPRVLRVRPTGPFEKDPLYDEQGLLRSTMDSDVRSCHPWHVIGEEEIPEEHRRTDPYHERWGDGEGGHLKEAAVSLAARYAPGLPNPQTGHDEWFHGTKSQPGDFVHGFSHNDSPSHEEEEMRGHLSHWNTLLGSHFAADHGVAEHFARQGASTDDDEEDWGGDDYGSRYQAKDPQSVIHARLHLRNPKVYESEFDMDHEAYEHEYGERKNYISKHFEDGYEDEDPHGEDYDPDSTPGGEEWPLAARYRHDDKQPIPREQMQRRTLFSNPDMPEMPERTRWLNSHPDKAGIAGRFKEHLASQGHDGILYGNEFEDSHATGYGNHHNLSAIIFHPHQAEITQHHQLDHPCLSHEEAEHQRARMPQPGQEELPGVEEHADKFPNGFLKGSALIAHFEEPRTAAPMHMQLKLFHQQPDPTLHEPGSGRHNPEDPEAHMRWRAEHDEEYEPDSCEHCGGDLNMPRKHAEEHREWLEQQDWHTDWNEDELPGTLHRGIGVALPHDVHQVVHDESRPVHERARALAGHLLGEANAGGTGLGNFWSADPDVSKTYAESSARRYSSKGEQTPVMFHVRTPEMEHIETDPEQLQHWGVYSYHLAGNREVPIQHQAPLHVTGISWASPGHEARGPASHEMAWHNPGPHRFDQDPAWTHHEFGGEGIRANASVAVTAAEAGLEVVAHFDDDDEDPDEYGYDDDDREDEAPEHEEDEPEEEPVAHRNYSLPYVSQPPEGELIDHLHHMHGLDARSADLYMNVKDRERWHGSEHQYKTNSTHQHDHPQGTPGEEHWPDTFQLSEHTDFPGGTRGDWSRVPGHTAPFKPLRSSESVSLPEKPAVPSFTWKYQTYGPNGGYIDKEQEVAGPFYHGSRSKGLRPGSNVKKGKPTNPWGDEGDRSKYVHFTTDLGGASSYARQAGGHVYEVEPTGEVKGGYIGTEWKSQHPLRVIRRVPEEELNVHTAAVVAHFEEGPLPEYHGEPLYHGTRSILEPGEHLTVEEARRHANNADIRTDPYVHATTDPREAHRWGERATGTQAEQRMTELGRERRIGDGQNADHAYRPRVYEVHPTGHVEPDLEYADTEHDSWRSASPMRVGREVEPLQCYDCPDTERIEEHWPGHPHYEYLRQQADEDEADREERGREGRLAVTAHFEDQRIASPQAGEEMWRHLQEAHGVKPSAGGGKMPGTNFMNDLHSEHHIIADGSHRAAVYAEHGRTHIPAFVTQRTIDPGQHTAKTAAGDDSLTWDQIGERHPGLYGDPEYHGEEAEDSNGNGIGDVAAHLYHDRPGHSYEESTGELHPSNGGMVFHPRTVEPSRIDYSRSDSGDQRVNRARKGYEGQQPGKVPPLVLVHRHGVFQVADGHHRSEGADKARKPVRAYVAYSPHEDEPFSDGGRGPFHGASAEEPRAHTDVSTGKPFRISYPGFPHTAEVPRPQAHEASRHEEITLIPVYDTAAAIEAGPACPPVDVIVAAAGLLGSWVPESRADAVAGVTAFAAEVLPALREGLLRVHRVIEEMPVDPDVAELVYGMARSALTASHDAAEMLRRLPPEASCEETGPPNR